MSLSNISHFFLNTWIWGMTWGIYHIPVNILVTFFFLKFVGKFRIMPSIFMAVFSKVFASALFTIVIIFLVFGVKLQLLSPVAYECYSHINILLACICLGVTYSAFQALFFILLNKFYSVNIRLTTMIVFISNIISALIMYRFLDID